MPNHSPQITPAHVARVAQISPDMARRYIGEEFPKLGRKREQQRFDATWLDELVALCESKRQRRCFNNFNAIPKPNNEGETS